MYTPRCETFQAEAGPEISMWYREDTNDRNTILSVLQNDEYLVSQSGVNAGGIYLDVGSHIGSWAVLVAVLGGEVWCYEPIPENLQLIIRNAQENRVADRIHARWGAVSGQDIGYEKIYYANPENESGRHHRFVGTALPIGTGSGSDYIYVPRVDIGQVLADVGQWQVDVMKIDCEGSEWNFLGGATAAQLNCFDWLIGEHHARQQYSGRGDLLTLCKGVFIDKTQAEDSNSGLFYFERNEQWT